MRLSKTNHPLKINPKRLITDNLAERLQDAFTRFGFSDQDGTDKIYNTDNYDANKIIVNPAIRIDEQQLKDKGFTDEMIAEVKRIDTISKVHKEKVSEPEEREHIKTKEEKKAEKKANKDKKDESEKKEEAAADNSNVEATDPTKNDVKKEEAVKEEPKETVQQKSPDPMPPVEPTMNNFVQPEEKGTLDKVVVEPTKDINLKEIIDDPLGVGKEGL